MRDAIFLSAFKDCRNLARCLIQSNHRSVPSAAVNQARMNGIGRDEGILEATGRVPILCQNLAVIAPAGHASGTAILLGCIHSVWKQIVGGDVVELPGRLVVPGTPCISSVNADDRALIHTKNHALGISGIDPGHVEVVPAWSTGKRFKRLAAIHRTIH